MGTLDIIWEYRQAFLHGLKVTIQLALVVWSIGLVAGILLGVLADRYRRVVGSAVFVMSLFLSGIPILVLLFWAHYPLQVLLNKVLDPFFTASWVLALVNAFAVTEAVRNTLANFPEQYVIAARVCGLKNRSIIWRIKLPIVMRQLIPNLLTSQVVILQATLFASLISVEEIFRVSQQVNASVYKPVQIYTALAFFFLIICIPLNGLALWLKAKYTRDLSER
ncbi:MAG: ABC transporter permease subunit [Candidatus Aminicenantes bacterium]|jgi:His/Glu/Gln/Arg/opine family amino acid ABC transporter permease subunit